MAIYEYNLELPVYDQQLISSLITCKIASLGERYVSYYFPVYHNHFLNYYDHNRCSYQLLSKTDIFELISFILQNNILL